MQRVIMAELNHKSRKRKINGPKPDSIIVSVKEARKILGKELSDKFSDEVLARMIRFFYKMAESI